MPFTVGSVHVAPSVDKVADENTAAERQTVKIAEPDEEITEKGSINQTADADTGRIVYNCRCSSGD